MALHAWETKVKSQAGPTWKNDPASEAQITWLTKLVSERDPANIIVVMAATLLGSPTKTKGQMSGAIDAVKALPVHKKPVPAHTLYVSGKQVDLQVKPEVTVGIYDTKPHLPEPTEVPGTARWIIVYQSKYGLRVKALWKSWDTKSGFSWKKASTAWLAKIQNGDAVKLDLAVVKKLGKDVGFCMYCGLTLSDPESCSKGYGSTCASHYGLPWGK